MANADQTANSTTKPPKSASTVKCCYPVTRSKGFNSTDPYGDNRGDHIHRGVDIVGVGGQEPIYAVCDGVITDVVKTGFSRGGWICLRASVDVPAKDGGIVVHKGQHFGYGHCGEFASVRSGQTVKACEQIGTTGFPGAWHVHFFLPSDDHPSGDGSFGGSAAPDPTPLLHSLFSNGDKGVAGSSSGGGGGSGSGGGQDVSAVAKAAAFSTFLELPGLFDQIESLALRGQKSLMNDKPLLPFIEQLCQASLRNFMSMPNGNFYAFFPDYFGGLSKRTAYWHIEDIEIIDGQIELSDDALATHVYIVGDIAPGFGEINIVDKLQSGGVVTVFNAFMADFLNGLPEPQSTGTAAKPKDASWDPSRPNLANKDRAITFLQKYGARPYYEEAPMVRSPYFEAFLAYQKFCLLWARQFLTTFTLTFMPEIFPGGIIAFPDHGLQCYVDEVMHNCSYETGFTTQVNISAPSALKSDAGEPIDPNRAWVHTGMIRAFALGDDKPDTSGQPQPESKTKAPKK